MGFLSKVGKGIKKGFKKVVGAIGKLASSKFGKILLAAVVVFTLGTALIAGGAAFGATTGGFAAKFVAGAKAFGAALASPLKAAKGLFNGAGAAGGQAAGAAAGAAGAAGEAAGVVGGAAETAAAVGAAAPASTPIGVLTSGASTAAPAAAAAGAGAAAPAAGVAGAAAKTGFLSKAAALATNPAIVNTVGQAAQGFAAGQAQEQIIKRQEREARRIDEDFRDPEKLRQLNEAAARPTVAPQGFIERARNVSNFMNNRPGSGPSVQAGDPNAAFGRYVVGY